MNDIFKEYGGGPSTVQECIEKFCVDLMMIMCGCPKKIVLDKHTYHRFECELLRSAIGTEGPWSHEDHRAIKEAIKHRVTAAGEIEIVCEGSED